MSLVKPMAIHQKLLQRLHVGGRVLKARDAGGLMFVDAKQQRLVVATGRIGRIGRSGPQHCLCEQGCLAGDGPQEYDKRCCPPPTVLLECGIIVNRDEQVRLADATYRKTIVQAVTLAIETYYRSLAGVE
jgi:hypothetical protein